MTRTLQRPTAWIAVTAFLGAFSLPLVNVHVGDADVAETVSLGPSHPVEQFEAVHPPVGGDHCVLCHWLRDISGLSAGATFFSATALLPLAIKTPPPTAHADSPVLFGRSSRAPPSLV
jgi:hypothetical protein